MPEVLGASHVAFTVTDIDVALTWFQRTFGTDVVMREESDGRRGVVMSVPGRSWEGSASVVRCTHRPARRGFDTWLLGLRFDEAQSAADVEAFQAWDAA